MFIIFISIIFNHCHVELVVIIYSHEEFLSTWCGDPSKCVMSICPEKTQHHERLLLMLF